MNTTYDDYGNADGEAPMNGNGGMEVPPFDANSGEETSYGADFDAGVEASEEEDPKKFIQQLTGKLSQSLKKYNDGLQKPDVELDKYVAGMILRQSVEGLDKKNRDEIIAKIDDVELPQEEEAGDNERSDKVEKNEEPMQTECARTLAGSGNIAKGGMVRKGYRSSPFAGRR